MSEKRRKSQRTPYVLTRKDQLSVLHCSQSDYFGVKWWAKRQNITITEAIHEMIHAFMQPRLVEMRRQALEDKAIEAVIGTEPTKRPGRIPRFRRKRS